MNPLRGKIIIITGASKGIGKAIALAMSKWDTNLILMARSEKELQELRQTVIKNGSDCTIYNGDVGDEQFVKNSIADVIQKFGRVDILINNAGFGIFKPADETTAEDWDAVFSTNIYPGCRFAQSRANGCDPFGISESLFY
jgi:NADP-dependent 3-hydroxy acid dehydrogenase YdfG